MLSALLARLGQMVFVMFGISVVAFLIFFATPGADPSARIAGRNASQETLAQVRADFGLDQLLLPANQGARTFLYGLQGIQHAISACPRPASTRA